MIRTVTHSCNHRWSYDCGPAAERLTPAGERMRRYVETLSRGASQGPRHTRLHLPEVTMLLDERLRLLAFAMRDIAVEMLHHGDEELTKHARELVNAAKKVDTWIAGLKERG